MQKLIKPVLASTMLWLAVPSISYAATKIGDVSPPISQRFAAADVDEAPDFQKHLIPLMGRLGCNGRACHGSFQGRGGFRLSLFGYDFKADHEALLDGRVDVEDPHYSLFIEKPTSLDD